MPTEAEVRDLVAALAATTGVNAPVDETEGRSGRNFLLSVLVAGLAAKVSLKPVAVMDWAISYLPGPTPQTVIDPFAGAGTTGISCIRAGHVFIGVEMDERYCEVAARRLEWAGEDQALFAPPTDGPDETPSMFGGDDR